jgi:hypothetical protein
MKVIKILIPVVLIWLYSCSSVSVSTDYDMEYDFNALKTYSFVKKVKSEEWKYELINKKVEKYISLDIIGKGYFLNTVDPDFKIAYYTEAKDKVDITRRVHRAGRWRGFWREDIYVNKYKEGMIVIDIIDAENDELVWRGWGTGIRGNRENLNEIIKEAIIEILINFPPKE